MEEKDGRRSLVYVNIDCDSIKEPCSASDHDGGWTIRDLASQDLTATLHLCREAFPLDYGESWIQEVCYIMSLAVSSEYRRRGIASLLLNHLRRTVLEQPPYPNIVFLHVLGTNLGAINFYKRLGFYHHSTLPNYYMINGIYHEGFTFVWHVNGRRSRWRSVQRACAAISAAAALVLSPLRSLLRLKFF
ncbi:N-alpha-acetyltransferase 60 [Aphelenchoides fujianensis]|nr:N-alpha-acetyltransferase 60 [Aphelenchoides fujianensis]